MYGVQLRRAAKSPTRNVTLEYRTKRCSSGTLISRRVIWIHMFRCGGCVRCVLRNPYALEFLVCGALLADKVGNYVCVRVCNPYIRNPYGIIHSFYVWCRLRVAVFQGMFHKLV